MMMTKNSTKEAKDEGYSNYFEITTRESLDQVLYVHFHGLYSNYYLNYSNQKLLSNLFKSIMMDEITTRESLDQVLYHFTLHHFHLIINV